MLLLSLKNAKELSKQTTCLSNMKQIGLKLSMYIGDYNDYIPISFDGNTYIEEQISTVENIKKTVKSSAMLCPSNMGEYSGWSNGAYNYCNYAWNIDMGNTTKQYKLQTFKNPCASICITDGQTGMSGDPKRAWNWVSSTKIEQIGKWHRNGYNFLYLGFNVSSKKYITPSYLVRNP
jgi:hypothetical protein